MGWLVVVARGLYLARHLFTLLIYSIKFLKLGMARPDFVGWTSLKMNSIKFWKLDRARPDFVELTFFLNVLLQILEIR